MQDKIKRIRQWMKYGKANPYALDINLTYACNLKCKFCNGYQEGVTQAKIKEIPDSKFLECVEEAIQIGIKEFHIAGDGEPFMKKNLICQIAALVKNNKRYGKITTNGTLVDAQTVGTLVQCEWDAINISIVGSNSRIHDYQVGKNGSFTRCMNTIKLINDYKKRFKKKYPQIMMATVITNKNMHDLQNIILLAKNLKIQHVSFEPLNVCYPTVKKLKLSNKQAEDFETIAHNVSHLAYQNEIYTTIKFLKKTVPVQNSTSIATQSSSFSPNFSPACFQPWYRMVVRPNGDVQPCCNFYNPDADKFDGYNLHIIWSGKYFSRIRGRISTHQFYEDCNRCNLWIASETKQIQNRLNQNRLMNIGCAIVDFAKYHLPNKVLDFYYFRMSHHE